MALIFAVLAGVALVATFMVSLSWFVRRLEVDNGSLDAGTTPALRYRVADGVDAAEAVVNLHHHGYDVTTRYEHGETDLYIATATGDPAERETIRSLIYDAGAVEHEDFRPPARVWHPDSVVFADET